MMKSSSCYMVLLCACLGSIPIYAQEQIDTVALSIRAFCIGADSGPYYILNGDDYIELPLGGLAPGRPVSISQFEPTLGLYRKTESTDISEPYYQVGEIALSHESRSVVLVIVKADGQNASNVNLLVINDDESGYNTGCLRIINLSPYLVNAKVGEVRLQVAPGATFIESVKVDEKSRSPAIAVAVKQKADKSVWEKFYQGLLVMPLGMRATWVVALASDDPMQSSYKVSLNEDHDEKMQVVIISWVEPGQSNTGKMKN